MNERNLFFNKIISQLIDFQQKPNPFTPGEAMFWDDPHISKQMLAAHLDSDTDAASRRSETIDRSVRVNGSDLSHAKYELTNVMIKDSLDKDQFCHGYVYT